MYQLQSPEQAGNLQMNLELASTEKLHLEEIQTLTRKERFRAMCFDWSVGVTADSLHTHWP